ERLDRRVDLDLDVGDVRDRVDGQAAEVVDAERADGDRGDDDEPPVADRELQQLRQESEHGGAPQCSWPASDFPSSALRMKLFLPAYRSPGARPFRTSTTRPAASPGRLPLRPSVTGRASNESPPWTKTTGFPSTVWIA